MMMQDSFMFLSSYPISQWTEKNRNVHHILIITFYITFLSIFVQEEKASNHIYTQRYQTEIPIEEHVCL